MAALGRKRQLVDMKSMMRNVFSVSFFIVMPTRKVLRNSIKIKKTARKLRAFAIRSGSLPPSSSAIPYDRDLVRAGECDARGGAGGGCDRGHFRLVFGAGRALVTVIDCQPGLALETAFANAGEICPGYDSPWAAPSIPMSSA